MSSTSNVQNLLVNVFRPVYVYDPTAQLFTPKIEMSNVDTYIGNSIYVLRAQVGDSASNVYVGIGSGNDPSASAGVRGCRNVTAVGYNAGSDISNVSNSVYVGSGAGIGAIGANSVIAIGFQANGNGSSNIYMGSDTGGAGSNNIYIGHGIAPGVQCNALQISGYIYGDSSNKWLGIATPTRTDSNNTLDVSGTAYFSGKIGLQMQASNSLNVNGITQSTGGFFSTQGSATISPAGLFTIGLLQQGTMLIQAQNLATPGSNYISSYTFVRDPTGGFAPAAISGVSNGYVTISYSTSNIRLSNTDTSARTFSWSITSFPLNP
jgi:hypothetical protein